MDATTAAQPFTIDISADTLADLRARLRRTRWPDPAPRPAWHSGMDSDLLAALVAHWADGFRWDRVQADLNRLPHFLAPVDGLDVHFVHCRADAADGVPVLALHGWPATFVQMTRLIPLLTAPRPGAGRARDVVVPSLPGFGFSARPGEPGWNIDAIARAMHRLMTGVLGYHRYAVRGSDFGLAVALRLGALYPRHVAGVHVGGTHLRVDEVPGDLTGAERTFVAAARAWYAEEGGYIDIQSTKPQTLGHALADSPAGLLAWIVEKHRTWCARPADLLSVFSPDDLLTTATVYWATNTVTSSLRLYQEERISPAPHDPVAVPLAVSQPAEEEYRTPVEWWERRHPVARYSVLPGAGHFPEWEAPRALAADLHAFLAALD
ncbi:microsomal epoxide hydrolase [Murinocardiopsis flavida]|uniref:Microsomal epoxide hydrolase n=1 Tax=Murinocardiopsis flavida TaxID=645275 RepID=A0A2P8DUK1_9ACTN|nr:epoxide hydrolase family protein [Murinocardiopsis flavida]PSL00891.1 microsomal epoxide hydrolase [Murinocardiopsis flavida]